MRLDTIFKSIFITLFLGMSMMANAQKVQTISFQVSGVCGMCEARIEKAVDVKGVKTADYDLDSHTLTLSYATKHISEEEIHTLLNEVGHDTEKSTASDEQYDSVHGCCKYREHGDH